MSDQAGVADLIEENEEEMRLLQDMHDKEQKLLDQTGLTEDLGRT